MKTIVIYQTSLEYGGVRRVSEILSESLINQGYKVHWLIGRNFYNDSRDYIDNIPCSYLPSPDILSEDNKDYYRKYLIDNSIDIVINQDALYESAKLITPITPHAIQLISVIHSNPSINLDWLWTDLMTRRNDSVTERFKRIARIALYPKIRYQLKKQIKLNFRELDKPNNTICVLSESYIKSIHKIKPLQNSRIIAIANPNTYEKVNIIKKENIALFVGRLDNRSKKLQYLIEIWRLITDQVNDWRLLIVGDGPDSFALRKMSEGIESISFIGYADPRPFYERASIFCLTSIFEGFPMCVTEAMQHGCVPIAFDSFPAIHDIISAGINGELIKPFRKKDYANRLLHLITENSYRECLSVKARESTGRFTRNNIVNNWIHLFNHD